MRNDMRLFIDRCVNEEIKRRERMIIRESIANRAVAYALSMLNEGGMDSFEKSSQMHTFTDSDGKTVTMTNKQWKKYLRDKKKQEQNGNNANNGNKPENTMRVAPGRTGDELAPSQLHDKIEKLLRAAAPLQSLATFREHAYRSYGKVADEIIKPFESEYNKYSACYRKVNRRLQNIMKWGASNEYAAYEEARKLSYDVEELSSVLFLLADKVRVYKKQIKQTYGTLPIYNGRYGKGQASKKELGFADQLFCKSPQSISNTISNLESAAQEISDIADMGRNPLDYEVR